MNTPYTPYFINTMLDHYQDRLQHTKCDEEESFVRQNIRLYRRMQKQSNITMITAPSEHMKAAES